MLCYCCSGMLYTNCCEPYLENQALPATPEQLMRSRYSAYCTENYPYILATYAAAARQTLSIESLRESAAGSNWFALQIVGTTAAEVQFKAFYSEQGTPYVLHETSHFAKEGDRWVYVSGNLHNDTGRATIGRNTPCVCGSGKKFKQCCLKQLGRR
ncbi:YchJ family protein [Alteromonas sp. ASW11-19]|uniref:YchJ family protein n=1 Tax=Alteromonas salexigens TaxID=2982530 RepID=A0ABT2VM85_9ALTE|nr:YchJ family protein [Alteromonas salexigens]MCU7553973.1 YchJ family protein [Alteromonas salexigens]